MSSIDSAVPPTLLGKIQADILGQSTSMEIVLSNFDVVYRTQPAAWVALKPIYNQCIRMRTLLRRISDVLDVHFGHVHRPHFGNKWRFAALMQASNASITAASVSTHELQQESTKLREGKTSKLAALTEQSGILLWNQAYMAKIGQPWTVERQKIEVVLTEVNLVDYLSAQSLYEEAFIMASESEDGLLKTNGRIKATKKGKRRKSLSARLGEAFQRCDYPGIRHILQKESSSPLSLSDSRLLLRAVEDNNAALIMLLQAFKPDLNIRSDTNDYTALHLAVELGYVGPAVALTEIGCDIHAQTAKGSTALHLAAARKDISLAQHLLARGADPNAIDSNGQTPLGNAVLTRKPPASYQLIRTLLTFGAKVTAPGSNITAIHEAVLRVPTIPHGLIKRLEIAPSLVDIETRIAIAECVGHITPLYIAIGLDHIPSINALLNAGANPNHLTNYGTRLDTYLILSIETRSLPILRRLLDAGADPNIANETGHTPLHIAAETTASDIQFAHQLLAAGANVNARTKTNTNTPLHMAVRAGRADIAGALLDSGADIEARLKSGASPFMLAAFVGQTGMLRFLRSRGADTGYTMSIGETAVHAAARRGHVKCAEYLVDELGMSVDAVGETGFAPLHAAAYRDRKEMVRWLLDRRADPGARMEPGGAKACFGTEMDLGDGSVVEVAKAFKCTDVVEMVEAAIAERATESVEPVEGDNEQVR